MGILVASTDIQHQKSTTGVYHSVGVSSSVSSAFSSTQFCTFFRTVLGFVRNGHRVSSRGLLICVLALFAGTHNTERLAARYVICRLAFHPFDLNILIKHSSCLNHRSTEKFRLDMHCWFYFLTPFIHVVSRARCQDRALLKLEMDPSMTQPIKLNFYREDYNEDELMVCTIISTT